MSESSELSVPAGPGSHPAVGAQAGLRRSGPAVLVAVLAVLAGTALLGVLAGVVWAAVAPRAVIVVIGPGSANVLNPETSAFIAADGWFTLLTAVGGVISGLLGYLFAVRRHGAVAMAAILAGAVAAALLAKWIGQLPGQAAANHILALGHPGTLLNEPLSLGGIGALAFWPLAAGLVAGGIEMTVQIHERLNTPRGDPPAPGDQELTAIRN
jgi:hypothetical protein